MRLPIITTLVLVAGLGGCSSPKSLTRVDPALLEGLTPENLASVNIARSEQDVADDAHAVAKKKAEIADDAVDLARAELDVASAEVDRGRVKLTASERTGTESEIAAKQAEYDRLLGRAEAARLRLALAKRELDVASLRAELAFEEARLADARVELAKGEAIEGMEMPSKDAVPLKDLRAQERYHELEVQIANKRLSAARVDEQKARNAYEAALDEFGSD